MQRVRIKPLSINIAFKGRRFKSDKYKAYEAEVLSRLKPLKIGNGKISLRIVVAYSNSSSDIDNCVKPFIDILQKKYNFNDKQIYELHVYKIITEKGKEFIDFEINPIIA